MKVCIRVCMCELMVRVSGFLFTALRNGRVTFSIKCKQYMHRLHNVVIKQLYLAFHSNSYIFVLVRK